MSEWIEWNGGGCPVTEGTLVDVRHRDGDEYFAVLPGDTVVEVWKHNNHPGDIIAYRLHERRVSEGDGTQLRRSADWPEIADAVNTTPTGEDVPLLTNVKSEQHTAQSILRRAADLIEERAVQRDQENGEKSMAKTVHAFNAIYGTELTEVQGWHFMELLKMVRSAYGVYVPDDFEDKVAYAALAAEAAK